jgi:hypothetical protein
MWQPTVPQSVKSLAGERMQLWLRNNATKHTQTQHPACGLFTLPCRREEVRLEGQEAENIQLSGSLLRACAAERSLFCADVQPGSARVFRCLAHNMASSDFGSGCRNALMVKLRRREANWRLDPPLRKACTADVDRWGLCVLYGCGAATAVVRIQ